MLQFEDKEFSGFIVYWTCQATMNANFILNTRMQTLQRIRISECGLLTSHFACIPVKYHEPVLRLRSLPLLVKLLCFRALFTTLTPSYSHLLHIYTRPFARTFSLTVFVKFSFSRISENILFHMFCYPLLPFLPTWVIRVSWILKVSRTVPTVSLV